jgi:hypothetical protein
MAVERSMATPLSAVVAAAGRESGDWTEQGSWWMRSTWSRLAKAETCEVIPKIYVFVNKHS